MGNVVHHLFKHKFKHKPASSRKTEARPHTFCVSVVKGLKVILGSKDEEEEEKGGGRGEFQSTTFQSSSIC